MWASLHEVSPSDSNADRKVLPIGRPIAERELYVLNSTATALCPIGETGELYIGGTGLAEHYLNDAKKTSAVFLHDLREQLSLPVSLEPRLYKTGDLARWNEHGELEFHGRVDWQVKINGLRIELGEIESVLRQVVGVEEAAVVVVGDATLVAFTSGSAQETELSAKCQSLLPPYMVPKAYVQIDSWPRTSAAKLDRNVLAAQAAQIAVNADKLAEEGMDSLGLVRLANRIEADEEILILNIKASASFLLWWGHLVQVVYCKLYAWEYLDSTSSVLKHLIALVSDLATVLFIVGLAFFDRHGSTTLGMRDAGLLVVYFEYLWLLPVLWRPVAWLLEIHTVGDAPLATPAFQEQSSFVACVHRHHISSVPTASVLTILI